MTDSCLLDCQCGASFAGAWSRDRLHGIVADRPCPGCGSTGRIYRAAIPGWTAPTPIEAQETIAPAPMMAPETPPVRLQRTPTVAAPITAPKPRAPLQGALAL